MALVVWSDHYATGIPVLDAQHLALFKTVNDLHEEMVAKRTKNQIADTLAFLVDHATNHFKVEEEFMERHGFGDLPAHCLEHRKLLAEVVAFQESWANAPDPVWTMGMGMFLGNWLSRHIQQVDLKYVDFIKRNGISV